jgi:hypothetical protein
VLFNFANPLRGSGAFHRFSCSGKNDAPDILDMNFASFVIVMQYVINFKGGAFSIHFLQNMKPQKLPNLLHGLTWRSTILNGAPLNSNLPKAPLSSAA